MGKVRNNAYEGKSPFSKLVSFLRPELGRIIISVFLSVFAVLCTIAAPLVLKEISTLILNKNFNFELIYTLGFITLGLYLLSCLFYIVQVTIVSNLCARTGKNLREAMCGKINRLPLNYFDTRNIGDILSYMTNDVDIISTTLNQAISTLISSTVTLIGIIIILFVLDWRIGLCACALLPIVLLILAKVGASSEKEFIKRSNLTAEVSAQAEEAYTAYNIVRVFQASEYYCDKFAEKNYGLQKCMGKADYLSGVVIPIMNISGNVLFSIVALVGGIIVAKIYNENGGTITPEINASIATIVASVTYADQLIMPLSQLAQVLATLQQTNAAAARVFSLLEEEDQPDESHKTGKIDEIKGNITFEHVKFGYNPNAIIIKDFSEVGKSGQKIAIVGPTGAGKTTMINLLMRFYELNSGKITIEGVDTRTLNRSYVRGLFGMVLQDTWLFEGTIMENLKYSRPEATDEEVIAACKATHCDEFIRQQPGGYQAILGEDCGLSAGQKQLLTIARAMIQNAPMLILDEATSSVDTRTEALIQEAMDKLMKGRTSFVIAHRLSTIKNSDLIIVMKDGDVIETGNHDQLMELNGFYASLYNAQFTGTGPQFS